MNCLHFGGIKFVHARGVGRPDDRGGRFVLQPTLTLTVALDKLAGNLLTICTDGVVVSLRLPDSLAQGLEAVAILVHGHMEAAQIFFEARGLGRERLRAFDRVAQECHLVAQRFDL